MAEYPPPPRTKDVLLGVLAAAVIDGLTALAFVLSVVNLERPYMAALYGASFLMLTRFNLVTRK